MPAALPESRRLTPGCLVPLDGDLETTARAWGVHPDTVAAFPAPADQASIPSAEEVLFAHAPDLAAEQARAAENPRSYVVRAGTNETMDGLRLRFFRPRYSR